MSASGLSITVREVAGTSIKRRLCKAVTTRPDDVKISCVIKEVFPDQADDPRWIVPDSAYRVQCEHCEQCYSGETVQFLHKRMYSHWHALSKKKEDDSALVEHYLDEHPGLPMRLKLIEQVKTDGYVDRKVMEAVLQATTNSTINRRIEGAGTVGNLYL